MGFSLQMFFDDLNKIINSDAADEAKLEELVRTINDAHSYAKTCGHIDG